MSDVRCSCTHEAGDSDCARHPSCGECGTAYSAAVIDHARNLERERIIAMLEHEMYAEGQGDAFEQQWRAGWNSRAKSLVAELRGKP